MDAAQLDNPNLLVFGWLLSIVAIVATAFFVVRLYNKRNKTDAPVSSWVAYTIGMFVAIFFLIFSQELAGLVGAEGSPKLLDSLFATLQMFGMNRDIELDTGMLGFLGGLLPLYLVYNAVMHLAAPVGTIGTILSLLGQLFSTFRLIRLAKRKDVFAFSSLNNESLALAKSTQETYERDNKDCLLVFANTEEEAALAGDAKGADMMCVPQSVDFIAKHIKGSQTAHSFVFSDLKNEVANLSDGVDLATNLSKDDYRSAQVPQVLVFSSSLVGGPVVDAAAIEANADAQDGINVMIKRVDWVRSTVNTLLDRYPLFTTGIVEPALKSSQYKTKLLFDPDISTRRILIVGDGVFAKEFLKGALWAMQLGDVITTRIDVICASADKLQQQFAFDAPEFAASDGRPYQGSYNLSFYGIDPEEGEYLDYLRESYYRDGNPTYVLVAYDDDLLCAKVARRTREILEQERLRKDDGSAPAFVAAVINDAELSKTILRMKARDRLYAIQPVGDFDSIYNYDNIFSLPLYNSARNLNRMYSCSWQRLSGDELNQAFVEADRSFANSEYNQLSSIASTLHRKYSLYLYCLKEQPESLGVVDWEKTLVLGSEGSASFSQELSDIIDAYDAYFESGDAKWLSKVEHDRWAAYVSTEGHECVRFGDLEKIYEKENRHDYALGRLHPCLTGFEQLPNLDGKVNEIKKARLKDGEEPRPVNFQSIDDAVLMNTRLIIAADEAAFRAEWDKKFGSSVDDV